MKTSELTGSALDWAVAKCEGRDYFVFIHDVPHEPPLKATVCHYSTDWSQGGPIIEREEIFLAKSILGGWTGSIYLKSKDANCILHAAPTPLVAAMRAFVASRLGDEVEVPGELA
jgi:hypothetical protein